MKILSFDPGKEGHFAYALLESPGVCVEHGILKSIDDLTPSMFEKNYREFSKQIQELISKLGLDPSSDRIIAERYMARPGMVKGNAGEFINIMIGIITVVAGGIPVTIIPSSQWKNAFRAKYSIGKTAKPKKIKKNAKPPKKPAKTTVKCKYENVWEFLKAKYPKSTIKTDTSKGIVIHEADAVGIGIYWWEDLTGNDILENAWEFIDKKSKKQVVI